MVVPGYPPRLRPAGKIARQAEDFTAGGGGPTIDYATAGRTRAENCAAGESQSGAAIQSP